ncbi:hypothetical protein EJ06DRAFT_480541 [Trichodelitschia bisporula]|uniref:F-box domain-containing protein n=1 Tax=Trichodelitschia bisporula TaxID=703511 RepID=A0A6G1HR23_9PEZI|nr:hypothetical protein EJ06DRAFT_480541 [Trichodelitschia bisporula]
METSIRTAPQYEPRPTLESLLSNAVVLRQIAPHLPPPARAALRVTSKHLHDIVTYSPDAHRYLDLSHIRRFNSRVLFAPTRRDITPNDEADSTSTLSQVPNAAVLYRTPLASRLTPHPHLPNVRTLILDTLPITTEFLGPILLNTTSLFNLRTLSIRQCPQLEERALARIIRHVVRPDRPAGTPAIKAIYFFGPKDQDQDHAPITPAPIPAARTSPRVVPRPVSSRSPSPPMGVTRVPSAWANATAPKGGGPAHVDKWYAPSGRMVRRTPNEEWAETLAACAGLIAFDTVLCRGPRHAPDYVVDPNAPHALAALPPMLATVALGPSGCAKCGETPEGKAHWGDAPPSWLPVLAPVGCHGEEVGRLQRPVCEAGKPMPGLVARCVECLRERWCERCSKWWCESCYTPGGAGLGEVLGVAETVVEGEHHHGKMGSKRECFGCGQTCSGCKELYIRACRKCNNEYCVVDNDGASGDACDWCNYSGRRSRV